MMKGRKDDIFVAFLDIEKASDRVNRKKLFEVIRCYGENLVNRIEIIYDGSMVKFKLENLTTGWCNSYYGVRQGCLLSSLLFNIYVMELGKVINNCVHGVNYAAMGKDGVMESKSKAGLLYADDVCLIASSEKDKKVIMEGWKTMIVRKLIYGCGALAWYQRECEDLKVIKNGFWQMAMGSRKCTNELMRGESGWSSFAERDMKGIVDWLLRIGYEVWYLILKEHA